MKITVIWTVITAVNYCNNIKDIFFCGKIVITAVNYLRITELITALITVVNMAVI